MSKLLYDTLYRYSSVQWKVQGGSPDADTWELYRYLFGFTLAMTCHI